MPMMLLALSFARFFLSVCVNYRWCWQMLLLFVAIVAITLQTYLQLVFRCRFAWNLPHVKVSCHIVSKQRIRYGPPVWSYTLYLKNLYILKIEFLEFPLYLFFSILYIIMSLCINWSFKICQNVAERNMFYLKCCYSWTKQQLSFDLRIW